MSAYECIDGPLKGQWREFDGDYFEAMELPKTLIRYTEAMKHPPNVDEMTIKRVRYYLRNFGRQTVWSCEE